MIKNNYCRTYTKFSPFTINCCTLKVAHLFELYFIPVLNWNSYIWSVATDAEKLNSSLDCHRKYLTSSVMSCIYKSLIRPNMV